ncbi:MAG: hypothetical protein QXL01_00125 [Thermoplasmatales archaeon]
MINVGDPVKANVVNEAFCSRKVDTDTIGKFSLLKPIGSGPTIDDTQKFINSLAAILGTSENDPAPLDYASNYIIADGDPYKVALEKLDAFTWNLRLDHDALDVREANNHAAQEATLLSHNARLTTIESLDSSFGGDKTFLDNVTINGDLIVNGNQTIINTSQLEVEDKIITLNKNGLVDSAFESGIELEEDGQITAFFRTTTNRDAWELKAPNRPGIIELEPDNTATTLTINRALFDSKADLASLGALAFKNTVGTNDIDDDAVTNQKLADNSISTTKLQNLSVTTQKIADSAITTVKLADGSVTTIKLANNAVTETKIASSTFDGFSIAGGSGNIVSAVSSFRSYLPPWQRTAGENIPAGVSVVRFGDSSLSENPNQIYLADKLFSLGKWSAIGIINSPTGETASSSIPASRIITFGALSFGTTVFSTSDVGKAVYLGSSGQIQLTPPTLSGDVVVRLGYVTSESRMFVQIQTVGVL